MYTTARKLSTACAIFAAFNILGLILLGLLALNFEGSFGVLFTCCLYAISTTAIAFLLTVAVRSMVQDANLDSENTSMRIKKLDERIKELERTK